MNIIDKTLDEFPDSDYDGITDNIDTDDDNDGIPDDLDNDDDNDGFLDHRDRSYIDTDNDGIPDVINMPGPDFEEIQLKSTEYILESGEIETVQDFLIKLGIKPCMHILEIGIFSLYNVIVRHTKIMNNLLKDFKIRTFKAIF